MNRLFAIAALIIVFESAEAQHNHGGGDMPVMHKKKTEEHAHKAPMLFQQQLNDIFISSQVLQESLVGSDSTKAAASAVDTKSIVAKADLNLLNDEALMDWMVFLKTINESLDQISASTNLSVQRVAFSSFSEAIYKSMKLLGTNGHSVFYQYCPMANGKAGGYWLSNTKNIRNPYLGPSQLSCVKVREILQ